MHLDSFIGKPYKKDAIGPEAFDCYGLVAAIRKQEALPFPPHRVLTGIGIKREVQEAKFTAIVLNGPKPKCLVLFKPDGKFVTHLGLVLENAYQFIHIVEGSSVRVERLDAPFWRHKLEGYYEFPVS